jgi:hypothetical protein
MVSVGGVVGKCVKEEEKKRRRRGKGRKED